MKKVLCFILCVTTALSLCGCGYNKTTRENEENDNRMTIVYSDGFCTIYRDNETGVQYLGKGSGGLCVMVNADGMPYIWEG